MYGVRKCSTFILLQVVDQSSQHHLLKRLSLIHCIFLPPLSKIRYVALCGSKARHRLDSESVSWCLETSLFLRHPSCTGNFPGCSDGKLCVYNVRELGSIPGLGRIPGEGNTPQYSCLENPMDGEAWCRLLSMGSQRVGHD